MKKGVFRISWSIELVMLNAVKHPRAVGILRSAQNDKPHEIPKSRKKRCNAIMPFITYGGGVTPLFGVSAN
jgi:hypothetical protein